MGRLPTVPRALIGPRLENGRELRSLFDDALTASVAGGYGYLAENLVHPRAGISRKMSFIQANSGYFARCSWALKCNPQACPSVAENVSFSAPAASVILFCTAPAGACGGCQVPIPRDERSTWPHSVLSLALDFPS